MRKFALLYALLAVLSSYTMAADEAAPSADYDGKCSLRFIEGANSKGKLALRVGQMADICLPVGWRVKATAPSDSDVWDYARPKSMPNVVIVKALKAGRQSTLWIYPVNTDGKAQEKLEVDLISTAKVVKSVDSPVVPILAQLCVGPKGAYSVGAEIKVGDNAFLCAHTYSLAEDSALDNALASQASAWIKVPK